MTVGGNQISIRDSYCDRVATRDRASTADRRQHRRPRPRQHRRPRPRQHRRPRPRQHSRPPTAPQTATTTAPQTATATAPQTATTTAQQTATATAPQTATTTAPLRLLARGTAPRPRQHLEPPQPRGQSKSEALASPRSVPSRGRSPHRPRPLPRTRQAARADSTAPQHLTGGSDSHHTHQSNGLARVHLGHFGGVRPPQARRRSQGGAHAESDWSTASCTMGRRVRRVGLKGAGGFHLLSSSATDSTEFTPQTDSADLAPTPHTHPASSQSTEA